MPDLVDRLRDPSWIGNDPVRAALADSVLAWDAAGNRYRAARARAAETLLGNGDPTAVTERAIEVAADLPMAQLRFAVGAAARGDTAHAGELFRELLHRPESTASYFAQLGLAQLALQQGDHAVALKWAESAAASNPYFANAFVLAAEPRLAAGEGSGAEEIAQRGLRFNPSHARLVEIARQLGPG